MAQCAVCGGTVAQDGRCLRCGALNFDAQTDAASTPRPPSPPPGQRPASPQPSYPQAPAYPSQAYPQQPAAYPQPPASYPQPPPHPSQSYPQQPAYPQPPAYPQAPQAPQYRVVTGRPPTPLPEIRFSEDPPPIATPPPALAPMDLRERPLPPPPDFEPSMRGAKAERLSQPIEDTGGELMEGFESTRIEGQDAGPRRPRAAMSEKERRKRNGPPPSIAPPNPTACPRCGTPLASLGAAFCEACGGRIPRARKPAAAVSARAAAAGDTKKCRECGYRTPSDQSHCGNCGNALRD